MAHTHMKRRLMIALGAIAVLGAAAAIVMPWMKTLYDPALRESFTNYVESLGFLGYLMIGLDTPLPSLDSVTRVEVSSTEVEVSRTYEDESGITKCYAHLNFNTQYKLWLPKEEERPLTVVIAHGNGAEFTLQIGEMTLSFNGKTFPLKQGEPGECLNTLTEHLLLK